MEKTSILIVEDDVELGSLLATRLEEYGFLTESAADGRELREKINENHYDLILLDVMLPGEDGLSLCRMLRDSSQKCPNVPIIFISALGETADKVAGLELGADDYVAKPFAMRELIARIRSVLRRAQGAGSRAKNEARIESKGIQFGKWRLDPLSRCVVGSDGLAVALSRMEFMLLSILLHHPGQVLTREQIIAQLGNEDVYDRNVDVQINRLRGKLGDTDKNKPIISTVRGTGYRLAVPVAKE